MDNVKRYLKKGGCEDKDWIGFVWLRMGSSGGVMNTVVNLQVPYKAVTLTS